MKRLTRNPVLVATVLLPMLVGWLLLWALGDRVDRIDAVPAAVVNLDEPVTVGQGKDEQVVAAGRLLAAGLTSPEPAEDHPLAWRLTTAEDASTGLREGDYYAVITIPEDFSETVAGLTDNEPETAQITVRSNDSASALVGVVSDQVGDVATARLNQQITATFLEGMYARTGELKASLGEAEQGASRLADGAARLVDGTARLNDGAGELAGGLTTLSGGTHELADGADRLSTGATRLADGAARLRSGSAELVDGADRLAGGLEELHARTRPLPSRTQELADGAERLAEGVDGWAQVLRGWRQACQADPVLLATHARLCAATTQAVGADGGNAEAMVSGSRRMADGTDRLAAATPELVAALDDAAGGAALLAGGADRLAAGAGRLDTGSSRLTRGADRLASGARELAAGAAAAHGGATALADGSTRVAAGSARLGDGSRDLASGLGRGAEQIPAVPADTRAELARAVAQPVVSDTESLHGARSATATLAPGVLVLALWLGAFVTYLVRPALPRQALGAAMSASRVALTGWLPAVLLGGVQGLLLLPVLGLFDAVGESPLGLAALVLVAAASFAAVHQAFVAWLGPRRGWLVSIGFAVLQAVSWGGLVPVDTAPAPIRVLSGVLPVPLAADGVAALTRDGAVGAAVGAAAGLLVWGGAALAVTTVAARRRQRVSLSDVRRRVAAPHAG